MKKLLLFLGLAIFFCSCQSTPPRETAQQFIKALADADLTTASSLVSADTKAVLEKAKKERGQTPSPEESFQFSTLSETISGEKAEVKNSIIALPLVKEDKSWKVRLDEKLLNEIQNREALLAAVKAKWESLQKEYEARQTILKDYISYKSSLGALSPKVQALNSTVNSLAAEKEWTAGKLQAYTQKQQALNKVIDAALEPSQAANMDLTLNYFLQISTAGDRIKAAEADYQAAAQKAHSSLYVPLLFKTKNDLKINQN
jgi:hypothetical protein